MVCTMVMTRARGTILEMGRGTISMTVTKHVLYAAAIPAYHLAPAFDVLSFPKEQKDSLSGSHLV